MVFDLIIIPNDSGADSSLASASISDRLSYVMSDPDLMKLYYIGASLAVESISDRASQVGYAVGDVSSRQLTAELGFVLQNQLSAVNMVSSCLRNSVSMVNNAVAAVRSCITGTMKVRDSFLKTLGQSSLAGFGTWSRFLEYRNNEGKVLRYCTPGAESQYFTDASEAIYGTSGKDKVHGYKGDDDIYGGEDDDKLFGYSGNDKLYGGEGKDTLWGMQDNDILHGGPGDDILKGAEGDDILYGSMGNDQLTGDEGNDMLCGGIGDDKYIFKKGFGSDIIKDSDGDETIFFVGMSPSDMEFTASDDKSLTIKNMQTGDKVTISKYDPARYTFVFGTDSYTLDKSKGYYSFCEK
jgi:hypothetical protein